jgi:hypothetical protein
MPHISREKLLQVMRDEVPVTEEELAHLPPCVECMDLFLKLVIQSEPPRLNCHIEIGPFDFTQSETSLQKAGNLKVGGFWLRDKTRADYRTSPESYYGDCVLDARRSPQACLNKIWLLDEYQQATQIHSLLAELSSRIDVLTRYEHSILNTATEQARQVLADAREYLECHVEQHGC